MDTSLPPLILAVNNLSREEICNRMENNPFVHFVEKYISPTIFIMGILTNAFTFVVLRHMSLGKLLKILLCVLCSTDFLASVAGLVSNLLEIIHFDGDMPFGYYCPGVIETYTIYFTFLMLLSMSHVVVIVIAVVRLYSMMKPFESRTNLKTRLIVKILIIAFLAVLISFIPVTFYIMWQSCFNDRDTVPICMYLFDVFPHVAKTKLYLNFLLFIFGPLIIILNLICVTLIRRAMVKSLADARELHYTTDGEHHRGSQSKKSLRVTRVLFYVLIVNTACIIPTCIQSVLLLIDSSELVFHEGNVTWSIFDVFAETLLQVIPCYNFWTYLAINKDFRRKLKQLVLCKDTEETSSSDNYTNNARTLGSMASLSQSCSNKVNGAKL